MHGSSLGTSRRDDGDMPGWSQKIRVFITQQFAHRDRHLVNAGAVAGQTIMHSHIHLIPRRANDMVNPRGGVRGVIPEMQSY